MKLIGCLCITSSCFGLGVLFLIKQIHNRSCVSAMIASLRYLKTEIMSTNIPLPDVFEKLSSTAEVSIRPLFIKLCKIYGEYDNIPMSDIWNSVIMGCEEISLSSYQRSELKELGSFLGRYDAEKQCSAIDVCIMRLEAQLKILNKKVYNNTRLYPGLGLSAGLMLSLIFI